MLNSKEKHKEISRKDLKDTKSEGKKWYVPARNLVFLSSALAFAEASEIRLGKKFDIFVGFEEEGQEHYPDTTQKFVDSINKVSKESTKGKYKIRAPLIKKDKEDEGIVA